MKKKTEPDLLSKTVCASLALILLSMIMVQEALAGRSANKSAVPLMVKVFTIEDKADKYRFIFVGERRFRVSPTATILDYNGESIPLGYLPVPCRAKVTYYLFGDNRDPLVEKIQQK